MMLTVFELSDTDANWPGKGEMFRDSPRSGGRPMDVFDPRIFSVLEGEPFHYAYSLANVVGVSYSIISHHLPDSLGMKNFHLCWVST
jgi:hypothetical protein